MRILITGGAGFIGRRLARLLVSQDNQVVVLDSLEAQVHSEPALVTEYMHSIGAELRVGSICDPSAVTGALAGADAVVHLAAQTGVGQSMYRVASYADANITGTGVLLDAISASANRPSRIVVASSRAIYGEGARQCPRCGPARPRSRRLQDLENGTWEPRCPQCHGETELAVTPEEFGPSPSSVYALSKAAQEQLIAMIAPTLAVEWMALRLSNVYGAGQPLHNPYTGVLSAFANAAKRNETVHVYEGGGISRDFVHVDDVVSAFASALTSVTSDVVLNIGSGQQSRLDAVARTIIAALGSGSEVKFTDEFRVGDIRGFAPTLGRAESVLGYSPRVSLEAGISEFARWAANAEGAQTQGATVELVSRGLLRRVLEA